MRYIIVLLSVLSIGCTKNIVKDIDVTVERQSAFSIDHILLTIDAQHSASFGENIEPFVLDIIITALPVTDVTNEELWLYTTNLYEVTETVSISSSEFVACNGKMVYSKGHAFTSIIHTEYQRFYTFTHEIRIR